MIITFKDLMTGNTAKSDYPFNIWWWAEGNGSCNCNRQTLFGIEHLNCDDDYYQEKDLQRFQAIDIEDHPDVSIEQQLKLMNECLSEKHKLRNKQDILKAINHGLY